MWKELAASSSAENNDNGSHVNVCILAEAASYRKILTSSLVKKPFILLV